MLLSAFSLPLHSIHEVDGYNILFGPESLSGILNYSLLSNFSPFSEIIGPGAIPAGLVLGWVMDNVDGYNINRR